MALSADLLSILVDPVDRLPLWYIESESVLYNPRNRRAYAITEVGIPTLLPDEFRAINHEEHARYSELNHVETGNLHDKK